MVQPPTFIAETAMGTVAFDCNVRDEVETLVWDLLAPMGYLPTGWVDLNAH